MKKGLLERLSEGIVIGDGGYVWALEKRGYVKIGPWTPEATIEHPEAVKQIHREFILAGSNVLQAFTFYASEDKLEFGNNELRKEISCKEICRKACENAREIAGEGDALVAGSISENVAYYLKKGKDYVQEQVRIQAKTFMQNQVDFIICEFFGSITEMEWTIEAVKEICSLPIVSTMRISDMGDADDVPLGECAVRMARAGADVVGVNCFYDPETTIASIRKMKDGLENEGLTPYLITQPNGFITTGMGKRGYTDCPEFPMAMESRTITRFDAKKYARAAYDLGVRYIGGCCGFEAYHIRAVAEELREERGGKLPPASEKSSSPEEFMKSSYIMKGQEKATNAYWENLVPTTGRKS